MSLDWFRFLSGDGLPKGQLHALIAIGVGVVIILASWKTITGALRLVGGTTVKAAIYRLVGRMDADEAPPSPRHRLPGSARLRPRRVRRSGRRSQGRRQGRP